MSKRTTNHTGAKAGNQAKRSSASTARTSRSGGAAGKPVKASARRGVTGKPENSGKSRTLGRTERSSRSSAAAKSSRSVAARGRAAGAASTNTGANKSANKSAGKGANRGPNRGPNGGARSTAGRARPAGLAPARKAAMRPPAASVRRPAHGRAAAEAIFREAVERAMQGYGFDAISLFRDAIVADPTGDLADDALFNIGAAFLQMRLVKDAEEAFTELLERYPSATIAAVYNGNEHGRTAAKALLGRMQARLAAGDFEGAKADRAALAAYPDSWVTDPRGARRTFMELAAAVMP